MSKLGNVLGAEYQDKKLSLVTKNIQVGDATFKVRIPTVGEQEAINKRLVEIDTAKIQAVYDDITKNLMAHKDEQIEGVEFTDDDVLVNGKSMREAARNSVAVQTRVMEAFKLIIPAEGADWSQITYEDIEAELPFQAQLEVVTKILEAINPDYKTIKEK